MSVIKIIKCFLFCVLLISGCDSSDQITVDDQTRSYRSTPDIYFEQVTHLYDSNFVKLFSPIDSIKVILEKSPSEISALTQTENTKTYEWKLHHQRPIQLTLHYVVLEEEVKIDFYNVDDLHWIAIRNKLPLEGIDGSLERQTYYFENENVQYLFVQTSTPEGLAPYQISLKENRFAMEDTAHLISLLSSALNALPKQFSVN